MHFGTGILQKSVHHMQGYTMSLRPITGDFNLDHLVKTVSSRFLHHRVTTSPLKYFELNESYKVPQAHIFVMFQFVHQGATFTEESLWAKVRGFQSTRSKPLLG